MIRSSLVLGLMAIVGVQAHGAGTVLCRAHAPQGTDLLFTVTDHSPAAGHDSLFGGHGRGRVTVRPVHPLKIQFPLNFEVSSYYSKAFALNVFSTESESSDFFRFNLQAHEFHRDGQPFAARIRYGRPGMSYQASCRHLKTFE